MKRLKSKQEADLRQFSPFNRGVKVEARNILAILTLVCMTKFCEWLCGKCLILLAVLDIWWRLDVDENWCGRLKTSVTENNKT